ncbi:MBL fold metallo-hydrolase RNA specificity domain-containing protein [Marinomonas sp. TW1]|uniref:MBL fold metallo-hydrolase RNA specificity domain-containing protein n=1 Tax=Marinomonas sp. TW1 TaxID=1561203 RepID=UPI0007AF1EB5|nr:MBL fold metallo-hydrolase [Marinomonas sp. TW1]KZN15081.1 RNA procession exonuclease [Marinomonas sp. TW1]
MLSIKHHGAVRGVTGSCHELFVDEQQSVLIDCGLFQGAETSVFGATADHLAIDFDLSAVQALIVTHVHIDHVGRIPYLLAAGFTGPIYCSKPSAMLLPLVIEDALKVGVTRNKSIIEACLDRIQEQIVPLDYQEWVKIPMQTETKVQLRLSRAGHILGSAYASFRVVNEAIKSQNKPYHDVVFSGDLGAPHSPLLPAPKSPHKADQLVIESTYGDRNHEDRSSRIERLQHSLERALSDSGTVLIPAFSIGRTQELLYELESIIHTNRQKPISHTASGAQLDWQDLDIIIDSPLANRFTQVYQSLAPYWDEEAQSRIAEGRHPLDFEQVTTIDDHETHLQTVDYLKRQTRPAIVIAASGMCAGGRIVNYIKALIGDERNDIVFVGYQAAGTPGRDILNYHDKPDGYVMFDNECFPIKAQVQQISGYSAHAGQRDLLNFIRRIRSKPKKIHLVHGDEEAKQTLKKCIRKEFKGVEVVIPDS